MYWNRTVIDIVAAMQAEIETKLEMGGTPILLTGTPATTLDVAAMLLALQSATVQRTDLTRPLLLAGGGESGWLGLLLAPLPVANGPLPPEPRVLYGGADDATYLATLATLPATQATLPTLAPPVGLAATLTPRLYPGAATAWEALPLLEVGEQPQALGSSLVTNEQPATGLLAVGPLTTDRLADPLQEWIAWGVMLLALCLVLSALLV